HVGDEMLLALGDLVGYLVVRDEAGAPRPDPGDEAGAAARSERRRPRCGGHAGKGTCSDGSVSRWPPSPPPRRATATGAPTGATVDSRVWGGCAGRRPAAAPGGTRGRRGARPGGRGRRLRVLRRGGWLRVGGGGPGGPVRQAAQLPAGAGRVPARRAAGHAAAPGRAARGGPP